MHDGDPVSKPSVSHIVKADVFENPFELIGAGKKPDRLRKIAVGGSAVGKSSANVGHKMKRIKIVEGSKPGSNGFGKFEAHKDPARFKDPVHLGEAFFEMGKVAYPKADHGAVEGLVGKADLFRIALNVTYVAPTG
jgi:hypothetical protein